MPINVDLKLAVAILIVVASIGGIAAILLNPGVPEVSVADRAYYACAFLCQAALREGQSLDDGPCISHGLEAWDYEGWVCDIAHKPRQPVDDLPENQCPEFGSTASRFIELDPGCRLIRTV
jgi:hypothetical protein